MLRPLRRYADFRGRAPRREFWLFMLFLLIGFTVTTWADTVLPTGGHRVTEYASGPGLWSYETVTSGGWITALFGLAMIVPLVALCVRRLHDVGRSAAWLLLVLVPLVGGLILLVFFLTGSARGDNRYGPDPLAPGADTPI